MTSRTLQDVAQQVEDFLDTESANASELRIRIEDGARDRVGTVSVQVMWQDAVRTPPRGQNALTNRESQIASLLRYRLSNREIARELGISEHTVRHHVERVLAKLGLASRRDVDRLTTFG